MGRLLYHGENLNSVPNDANLVKMNDGTNVEDSIESVKNAFTDIVSDAYVSTKAYSVGDLVIYNNKLWKCKVACSGQTPSENTYWTQTTISNSLFAIDGTYKLLGYSNSNTQTTITLNDNLSKYRNLIIAYGYSGDSMATYSIIDSTTLPISLFKVLTSAATSTYIGTKEYRAYAIYVSDTSVKIAMQNGATTSYAMVIGIR